MDTDELIQCPYNESHSILSSRMQFHLTKCRLQHPNAEKATCPFNSTHIVNKVELELHCEFCNDRLVMDNFVYVMGSDPEVPKPVISKIEAVEITGEEIWEAEEPVSVLEKVQEACKQRATLQTKVGVSKSERKAFRQEQRLKAIQLNNAQSDAKTGYDQSGANKNDKYKTQSSSSSSEESISARQARQTTTLESSPRVENERSTVQRNPINPWVTQKPTEPKNNIPKKKIAEYHDFSAESPSLSESFGNMKIKKAVSGSATVERDPNNPWLANRSRPSLVSCTNSNYVDQDDYPTLLPVSAMRRN